LNPAGSQRGESQPLQPALIRPVSSSCRKQQAHQPQHLPTIFIQSLSKARRPCKCPKGGVQESSESKKRLNRRIRPDQTRACSQTAGIAWPTNILAVRLEVHHYLVPTTITKQVLGRGRNRGKAELIRADRALPLLHRKDSYHPLLARPRSRAISQHPGPHYPSSYPTLLAVLLPYLNCWCSSQSSSSSTTHLGLSQPSRVFIYFFCCSGSIVFIRRCAVNPHLTGQPLA
jgi:hypothetical protein